MRRRYLLGELSDEERTDFEEKYFRDDEEFEHLLAEEEDLIDAYVRGDLSPAERLKLKNAVRFDWRHAPRLSFAEILAQRVRAAAPSLSAPSRSSRGWVLWPVWKSALAFGVVAALLLVTMAYGLLSQRRFERELVALRTAVDGVVQLQREQRAQLSAIQSRTDQLVSSINQRRTVESEPAQQLPSGTKIASLMLKRTVRGQATPSQLFLTPDTERVELKVPIEGEYRSVRAVLTRIDGQDVWRSGLLEWELVGSSWIARVGIPPELLKEREYVLRLLASERSGEQPTEIGEHYFRVVRN